MRTYHLFTLTFLFFTLSLNAQQSISELQQSLPGLQGQQRVEVLSQLADKLKIRDAAQAIEYAQEAFDLSSRIAYQSGIIKNGYLLGILYRDEERYSRAVRYAEQGLEAALNLNSARETLRGYKLLETIHMVAGHDRKTAEYRDQYQRLKDRIDLAQTAEELAKVEIALDTTVTVLGQTEAERRQLLEQNTAISNTLRMTEEEKLRQEAELAITQMKAAELERAKADLERETANLEKDAALNELALARERYIRNRAIAIAVASVLVLLFVWQRYRFTQQRKMAQIEKQRAERLQEIDRLKDQFLANTSHELRTPLNGIIGIAEWLYEKRKETSPKILKENLSVLIAAGKRLNNLVNDIMDFSRLKNAELRLHPKPLYLRPLVDVMLRINYPMVQGKNIDLVNEVPVDLPPVWADEERLQQILQNLIANAIKFTRQGKVTVQAKAVEDQIEISVTDTGIGIAPEKLDNIFQAFHQGDGSTVREHIGTGLGLSITRYLIELHGGNIWVTSEVDKGSTFYFTVPLSDQQPDSQEDQEELQPAALIAETESTEEEQPGPALLYSEDRVNILVVDDEPINQHVLRNHLDERYYDIQAAMNGEEALEAIHSGKKFDLVLLDVMMPRMSGYEVCERIREKYLPSELPIIMVTAKNLVKDLVTGLNTGANDYLAKPFSRDEFLARVKTQINLHQINKVTGRFVPNAFLRSLGRENITEVHLGDQAERTVTVLFFDIRDYTTLSEIMTPEQNFKFVHALNRRLGPIINEHHGFINQYLGDAIMALFQQNAVDALKASIEMQHALQRYNMERQAKDRRAIRAGIGFHTGQLIMGIIGDDQRMDAATISDTVNTASRLESLNKYYGSSILLSESSLSGVENQEDYNFRMMGKVLVKGKKVPIGIYECIDGDLPATREKKLKTMPLFENGYEYYFAKEFSEAARAFEAVLKENPDDGAAQLFLSKSLNLLAQGVSEDWTGIERMTEK